jgi:uncharacterized protein YjiS (DUF1127 family)
MTISLSHVINSLIWKVKIRKSTPRLKLSKLSDHDLKDLNIPHNYRQRLRPSHELDDWRARLMR